MLEGRLGPYLKSHMSVRADNWEAMITQDSKWGRALPMVLGVSPVSGVSNPDRQGLKTLYQCYGNK